MAQTFIGNLILRLQENVSAGAKKAASALRGVDAAARAVGSNGSGVARLGAQMDALNAKAQKLATAGWGPSLQARFEKLGASAKELDRLRSSWDQLQARIASGGLAGKLKKNEIQSWSLTAVGELTRVRAAMKSTEGQARAMGRAVANAMKPVYTGIGLGTGAYVGGRLGRGGLTADASVERERFRLKASGFNPDQAKQIEARAQELASKYGMFTGDIMESLREASLAFPNMRDGGGKILKTGHESAMELSESIIQFRASMANILGDERATSLTRAMLKSFDIMGITDPKVMRESMDSYARMNRVIGKDVDPEQMLLATKYMRAAGKAFDPDFIYGFLPALIGESNGSDVGNSMRALYTGTVGNRRSKKSNKMFRDYGLLDEKGNIRNPEQMRNPLEWIEKSVKPALAAKGVDITDNHAVAQILSAMFDNRLSADVAQKLLEQSPQYRDTQEKAKNAQGLDGAVDIRKGDPFAGWKAFVDSLQNLAAATGITGAIAPALNAIADGINTVANAAGKLSPEAMAGIGVAAGAFAAMAGVKAGGTLLALTRAGPELVGAAGELRGAAAALRGAAPGGDKKGGGPGGGLIGGAGKLLSLVGVGGLIYSLAEMLGIGPSDVKRLMEERAADSGSERQALDARRRSQIEELDAKIREADGGPAIITDRLKERRDHLQRALDNRFIDPLDAGREAERGRAMMRDTAPAASTNPPSTDAAKATVAPAPVVAPDKSSVDAAQIVADATQAAFAGLPPIAPQVDTTSIDAAHAKSASAGFEIVKNLGVSVAPQFDTTSIDEAAAKATAAGEQIKAGLGVSVAPQVDTSNIQSALALVQQLVAALRSIGPAGAAAGAAVGRELRAAQSDYGVSP